MVGELEGIVDPCAVASTVLNMSSTSHIIPEILKLGRLNFPVEGLGNIFGVGSMTDDGGAVVSIFVDCLSPVCHWLYFGLTNS